MIIYRPNKVTLAEAMKEAKEFESEKDMKEHIISDWGTAFKNPLFTIDDIVIDEESEMNDPRNGWKNTKYVCIKRLGSVDYVKMYGTAQAIGFCATEY